MKREDLEYFLKKGYELGFVKQTDDPQFLGWILLRRMKPNNRYLELLQAGEESEYVATQESYRRSPFQVLVQELDRDVHESDRYETNEDYRVNERHYFSSLDEVEEFVNSFGHTLENIKWLKEINGP